MSYFLKDDPLIHKAKKKKKEKENSLNDLLN